MDSNIIRDVVARLLEELALPYDDIRITEEADGILRVDIDSSIASKIIGWHGETLNSLQHLVKCIARTQFKLEESPTIIVDVDGYRRAQEEKVLSIAKRKVEYVRKQGKRIALPPMSPYFRRVVHLYIANDPDLQDITTESIGRGDYRQIVLKLKNDTRGENNEAPSEEMSPVIEEVAVGEDGGWDNLDV